MDFGNEALLAHALPFPLFPGDEGRGSNLCTSNVVDKLIEEASTRGMDISKAKAYVNASSINFLNQICTDLVRNNIFIIDSNIDLSYEHTGVYAPRNIWFDPTNDSIMVYVRKFK